MKRLSIASTCAAVLATAAFAQLQTLTQSVNSVTVLPTTSGACGPTPVTYTVDNGYFRTYNLFSLPGNIDIVSITFGVQACVTAQPGGFPISIRILNDPTPGSIAPYSGLMLRHVESFSVPQILAPTLITRVLTGPTITFTPSEQLVVEIFSPDGAYSGSAFLIGSNNLGQTAPGFIRAPACGGLSEPTDLTNTTFPNMHLIIDVNYVASAPPMFPGTNEDLILQTGINGAPRTGGFANQMKTVVAGNSVAVEILSPTGMLAQREVVMIAQPYPTGFPPFPPAAPNIHMTFPGMYFLIGGVASPLGAPLLAPGGTALTFTVPPGMTGTSVLFQGVVITWGPPLAANGLYATTEAHEIRIL